MSFFLKAATLALQEYPVVNSAIDGNQVVKRNYIDISVAVATPTGLLVPVLRDCQNMKFHNFEQVRMGKDRASQHSLRRARRTRFQLKTCREAPSLFQTEGPSGL